MPQSTITLSPQDLIQLIRGGFQTIAEQYEDAAVEAAKQIAIQGNPTAFNELATKAVEAARISATQQLGGFYFANNITQGLKFADGKTYRLVSLSLEEVSNDPAPAAN